jgi:hypothetical protein
MFMLVTKPRNLHYRYCPLQYWYGIIFEVWVHFLDSVT